LKLHRFVPFTASIEDAIRILKESKVTVLPISYRAGITCSTVSFPDLVKQLVKVNFEKDLFLQANVCEALSNDQILIVQPNATIKDCILQMDDKHSYEIGLLKPGSSEIGHFISQSDIVRFMFNNRGELMWDRKVKLLHLPSLGSDNVGTVHDTASVADSCSMLTKMGVNAIAIVDKYNAMQACLTPTSFQELSSKHWIDFQDPIGKFKVEGRDQGWVYSEETLESVIEHIVLHNIHRIWVISDSGRPAKIITLSDIIRHFVDLHKRENKSEK
jgi:CBS-domain-containing membrane protein